MYYSTKTTNKTFINMWRYLQRIGVENNIFMLQTIRKELVDFSIDNYMLMDRDDPKFKIYRNELIAEARENIWFYFRELIMVPDDTSITGYKHFELTPKSMLMIYIYSKCKSFINISSNDDICLHFLWNLHKSLYNTDIVLVNNLNTVENISNNIKRYIANMDCQVPLGSSQILSDAKEHFLQSDLKAFQEYYTKNSHTNFIDHFKKLYNDKICQNKLISDRYAIFILERDMPLITYSYIIDLVKSNEFEIYLNGIENHTSIDNIILNNFLKMNISKADDNIYDIDQSNLEPLYLI